MQDAGLSKNAKLNQLRAYRHSECADCRRKWPHTTLDVEAVIHHGGLFRCVDRKACKKQSKKLKIARRRRS